MESEKVGLFERLKRLIVAGPAHATTGTVWLIGTALIHARLFAHFELPIPDLLRLATAFGVFFALPGVALVRALGGSFRSRIALLVPVATVSVTSALWVADLMGYWHHCAFILAVIALAVPLRQSRSIAAFLSGPASLSLKSACFLSLAAWFLVVQFTIGDGVVSQAGELQEKTRDMIFHLSSMQSLQQSPRLTMMYWPFEGFSYHFFEHYYIVSLARLSHVPFEMIYGYWARYVATISLTLAIFALSRTLGMSVGWAFLATLSALGAYGLHVALYFSKLFLEGTSGTNVFFYMTKDIVPAMYLQLGGFQVASLLVAVTASLRDLCCSPRRAFATGLLLGGASLFYQTITVAFGGALTLLLLTSSKASRRPLAVLVLAFFATGGGLLLMKITGSGSARMIWPDRGSLSFHLDYLGNACRWWGVQLLGFFLLFHRKGRMLAATDISAKLSYMALFAGIPMTLLFNFNESEEYFKYSAWMSDAHCFIQLTSLFLPVCAMLLVSWSRSRWASCAAVAILIFQGFGYYHNSRGQMEVVSMPYSHLQEPESVSALKRLGELCGRNERVATNSYQVKEGRAPFISAISGCDVVLEGLELGHIRELSAAIGLQDEMDDLFGNSPMDTLPAVMKRYRIRWIVELNRATPINPRLKPSLEIMIRAPKLTIYRVR
jgi:hypothetical protein